MENKTISGKLLVVFIWVTWLVLVVILILDTFL